MKTTGNPEALLNEPGRVCLAAGFFDGVHLGHRRILDITVSRAKQLGAAPWVLTFDDHPRAILSPEDSPPLLTSTEHKLRLLEAAGIHGCLLVEFTREFAEQEPRDFVEWLYAGGNAIAEIIVGDNWRFGKKAAGTPALLAELAKDRDCTVHVVEPITWSNELVSSSRIRTAVLEGRLDDAAQMLGRPASILGTVIRGRTIGRELGFPTANLDPHHEALPPHGVYAVNAVIDGAQHPAVTNIGTRPTFGNEDNAYSIEVHIPDISEDLYGNDIEISFARKLRDEQQFESSKTLSEQIARDVEMALDALSKKTLIN